MNVQSKISAGFALALLVLAALGGLSFWSLSEQIETSRWVEHTWKVTENLDHLMMRLLEAETGVRGFVLTGRESFLEPWHGAQLDTAAMLRHLRSLTSTIPVQQRRLDELEPLIGAKLDFLAQTIQVRRRQGAAAADRLVSSGRGNEWMNQIRGIVRDMDATEAQLLQTRTASARQSAQRTILLLAIGGAFAFALILLSGAANARHAAATARAEAALQASEEHLRLAVAAANLGTWHLDVGSNQIRWSEHCHRLFGTRSDADLCYADFLAALHPDDREHTDLAVQDSLRTRSEYSTEYRALWPDGSEHWIAARGRGYYDAAGNVLAMRGVVVDIAERKRVEELLQRHREELLRSNQDLERFAHVVSHDLKEPLRSVTGFTQLLADRFQQQLPAEAREFIAFAQGGAARMRQLIDDLLAYSRTASRPAARTRVAADAALARAMDNLQASITESGAVITSDPLPALHAAESQLVQLFQNLLGNAIKFCGPEPPRVHVTATQLGRGWLFSVRDNGIGLEPQFAERIFDVFQRLHSRAAFPGTGIGLAICKRIVERHGGRIWVDSRPGLGAAFHFILPDGAPHTRQDFEGELACSSSPTTLPWKSSSSRTTPPTSA